MSELKCPFYQKECILKPQAVLPDYRQVHNCKGLINHCSFFVKEKLKQLKVELPVKIIIKQVENVFLVKADGIVYPTNILLEHDEKLDKMSLGQLSKFNNKMLRGTLKVGYPYAFDVPKDWKIHQKKFINTLVAGESRLVNEAAIASGMKKSILFADSIGLSSLLILPSDYGTHDINLTSLAQLSAIFLFCSEHKFINLKHIYICMEDEESEQAFIEYFNRIFGDKHEQRHTSNTTTGN